LNDQHWVSTSSITSAETPTALEYVEDFDNPYKTRIDPRFSRKKAWKNSEENKQSPVWKIPARFASIGMLA
jgi:hypothetical protein